MKQKRKNPTRLSPVAERTLIHLLTPIALSTVATAFSVSSLDTYELARAYPLLCDGLEHIMMSLLLAVGGTLLLDIEIKRNRS